MRSRTAPTVIIYIEEELIAVAVSSDDVPAAGMVYRGVFDDRSGVSVRNDTVLVVGAGPTGLLLAIELLRREVPVRVIDGLSAAPNWSAAILIKQRSLEILESIGVSEKFAARGEWVRGVRFHSAGEELAGYDFDHIQSPFPNALSIPESTTVELLIEELQLLGGKVEWDVEFVSLAETADGVSTTLRDNDGVETKTKFQWLVGTDGHHSVVRHAIGDEFDGHDYHELWAVFDTQLENWDLPRDIVFAQLDPPLVLPFALPPDRWRIYFRADAAYNHVPEPVISKLRLLCPEVRLRDPEPPEYFRSHSRLARTFQCGRVLLAGDAAHASNPIEGHGMNSGLQDAFNLGWKLAAVAKGQGTEALLHSYNAERGAVDREIVLSGDAAYGWVTDKTGKALDEIYEALKTKTGASLAAHGDAEVLYRYPASELIEDCRSSTSGTQVVGMRVIDVDGLLTSDGATSLHVIINSIHPTVLLLGAKSWPEMTGMVDEFLAHALGRCEVRFVAVAQGSDLPAGSPCTVVADLEGRLHNQFGALQPTVCVVRPDQCVSLLCHPPLASQVEAHLAKMFR